LGEQQNLPIEFVDGYISQMSVSIPWASLLRDSSFVEVTGLMLTIQPKQRADSGMSIVIFHETLKKKAISLSVFLIM
jgi:autophagy-related protein 2